MPISPSMSQFSDTFPSSREARSQTTKNNVFEGRSYYTQAESESAFKHAEAVGALQGAFLSWDVGFWVVLRGQVPGIYEGRYVLDIHMSLQNPHLQVRFIAPTLQQA